MAGTTTTSSRSSIGDNSRPMEVEGVQEKEPFHPPPAYHIDTSAAAIGFPSPSSAYFSPQDPAIDFQHPKPKRARMGASHTSGDAPAAFTSPITGSGGHDVSGRPPHGASGDSNHHTATSSRHEKRGTADDASGGGATGALADSKVAKKSRPISDPHGVGTSSSPTTREKTPASLPSRGGSRSSVPPNGVIPTMTSGSGSVAEHPQAGTSAPPLQTPNRLSGSILDYFPEQKRLSLASERRAPTSPGPPSRRASALAEPQPVRAFTPSVVSPTPTTAAPTETDMNSVMSTAEFVVLKINDFGYAENDPRRKYDLKINLDDPPRPPSPAPPGFIPPMNMDEADESENSLNSDNAKGQPPSRGEGGSSLFSKDSSSNPEECYEEQPSFQLDTETIDVIPGVYRALYPFEPEGSAEMALYEGQEVTCLGRGGGEGWLVAVKEVTKSGEVIHALVPEAYMQLVRELQGWEMEEAMGKR